MGGSWGQRTQVMGVINLTPIPSAMGGGSIIPIKR